MNQRTAKLIRAYSKRKGIPYAAAKGEWKTLTADVRARCRANMEKANELRP